MLSTCSCNTLQARVQRHRPEAFSGRLPRYCSLKLSVRSSSNGSIVATALPTVDELKQQLTAELTGVDRGIFGGTAAKKAAVLKLITQLEQHAPHKAPAQDLSVVQGDWRLLYSTITIMGAKRTKLGLREFVRLGEFIQNIDTNNNIATNTIQFSVTGLSSLKGSLTIRARYAVAGDARVDITYLDSALTPKQLQVIFEQNLDLLLSIFNPEGHLDITYVDASWRVGRDDKGNVFLLERA